MVEFEYKSKYNHKSDLRWFHSTTNNSKVFDANLENSTAIQVIETKYLKINF